MSSEQLQAWTKNSVIPISLGMLLALIIGVWRLSSATFEWSSRLNSVELKLSTIEGHLEQRTAYRWDYRMEKFSHEQFLRNGKRPDPEEVWHMFVPDGDYRP